MAFRSKDNDAYDVQPASGAPPKNHERFKNIPPKKNNQKPNEFKNGNATSRAPICKWHNRIHKRKYKRHGCKENHRRSVHRQ